jgi:hypothetical protein
MITIERMDAQFEQLKWDEDATLSRDFVRACMAADDLEVLGTLYRFVAEESSAAKISPPLTSEETLRFASGYLGRCLREDPLAVDFIAQRSCTRFGAGWEVVRWYVRLFKATADDGEGPALLRAMLARIYAEGDAELRAALTGVTLAHLFASAALRRTFSEWKNDPILAQAYAAAMPAHSLLNGLRVTRGPQPLTRKSRTAILT